MYYMNFVIVCQITQKKVSSIYIFPIHLIKNKILIV